MDAGRRAGRLRRVAAGGASADPADVVKAVCRPCRPDGLPHCVPGAHSTAPRPACTSRRHLRRLARWRGARAAEGARLESVCTHKVPRVRIPPSPLDQLVWGPVQCSPRSARLRASDAPRPRRPARALSRSASHSSGGPSAARVRFAHAAHPTPARLRRAPQTPAVGAAPLGASLPLPCASRPRRLLYGLPRGRRAVAARSCARRRREPRQVRKEAAVPNVLLCRRAP